MQRLLHQGDWYFPVSPEAMYETDFQDLLASIATDLYPSYRLIKFTQRVASSVGAACPDFALVHNDYHDWLIVEVEMAGHSLVGHVLRQVEVFADGAYGDEHINALCQRDPALNRSKMVEMLKGQQPRVLVIVNSPKPEWTAALARHDALLAVVEQFRSARNRVIYRVNGNHPADMGAALSECRVDRVFPNWLVLSAPASIPVEDRALIEIRHKGELTRWIRRDIQDTAYLCAEGTSPLDPAKTYIILDDGAGLAFMEKPAASLRGKRQ